MMEGTGDSNGRIMRRIPFSYWESLGYGPGYALDMQFFVDDLATSTCQLKYYNDAHVVLRPNFHWESQDRLIFHDDLLCPRWKRFADALTACDNDSIEEFQVCNIQLTKTVLDMLAPALKTKNLVTLDLRKNNFGRDGILFVTEYLEGNSTLGFLQLNENWLDEDLSVLNRFADAVRNHPCLGGIILSGCNIHDDSSLMPSILLNNLKTIDLSDNYLRSQSAALISQFLSANPRVKFLGLKNNQFNDDDAALFSWSLKRNDKLENLDLNENDISMIGGEHLLKAIFDTSSLNSIADSNHTCDIELDCLVEELRFINILSTWERSRKQKIFYALRRKKNGHFNLHYFNDISLSLVPYMLALLQEDDRRKESSLSVVFEVLRNWKMPVLYDNLVMSLR